MSIFYTNRIMAQESSKYRHFSRIDFIQDSFFQDWVIKADSVNTDFWKNFLEKFPEKQADVESAYQFLKSIRFAESYPKNEKIEESLENALRKIGEQENAHAPGKVRSLYKYGWAAAAVLILVSGFWFLSQRTDQEKSSLVITPATHDISPGGNKAILTLSDGSQVILDSANNGAITRQGNVTIIKLEDGQLAYESSDQNSHPLTIQYNTITTPRGGQYQIELEDGSKVWLNAESSLKFPTVFAGNERKVEIMGEGYFEIAQNAAKPFIVNTGEVKVKVLGTHFNINAYEDEGKMKVTLLEGRVEVLSKGNQLKIEPGQQAEIQNELVTLNNTANIEAVMAWKNGKFYFEKADIKTVMNQISRWYDVDVEYRGEVTHHFGGAISRNVNVSRVFEMLELTEGAHFKIEGKKVIVMP